MFQQLRAKNSQKNEIFIMSCVLRNIKFIRKTKKNTYTAIIKNAVLYAAEVQILCIQQAVNHSTSTLIFGTIDKSTKTKI